MQNISRVDELALWKSMYQIMPKQDLPSAYCFYRRIAKPRFDRTSLTNCLKTFNITIE